jgi:hypothetical protein
MQDFRDFSRLVFGKLPTNPLRGAQINKSAEFKRKRVANTSQAGWRYGESRARHIWLKELAFEVCRDFWVVDDRTTGDCHDHRDQDGQDPEVTP